MSVRLRRDDPPGAEPIAAAQHPLGLQENGRRHKDLLAADQCLRFRKLLPVVARQIADDDVSIDREHGTA